MTVIEGSSVQIVKEGDQLRVMQSEGEWFYSRLTNIHISWAVMFASFSGKMVPVLVRLRDSQGHPLSNVKIEHFGDNLSSESFLLAFNINGYLLSEDNILDSKLAFIQMAGTRKQWSPLGRTFNVLSSS